MQRGRAGRGIRGLRATHLALRAGGRLEAAALPHPRARGTVAGRARAPEIHQKLRHLKRPLRPPHAGDSRRVAQARGPRFRGASKDTSPLSLSPWSIAGYSRRADKARDPRFWESRGQGRGSPTSSIEPHESPSLSSSSPEPPSPSERCHCTCSPRSGPPPPPPPPPGSAAASCACPGRRSA